MPPLNEAARRKPNWKPGRGVLLANGEVWQIPRPVIVFTVDETGSGFVETLKTDDPGGEYLKLVKRRREMVGNYEFFEAEVLLGCYLLRWNYDLTPAEVATLMPMTYETVPLDGEEPNTDADDEPEYLEAVRIRKEVLAVVRGEAPKRRIAGTDSLPTPLV